MKRNSIASKFADIRGALIFMSLQTGRPMQIVCKSSEIGDR